MNRTSSGRCRSSRTPAGRRHDALANLPPSPGVDHLRDLLTAVGLLPVQNREILRFEQWSSRLLATIEPPEDRQIIARYIAWHHRRRLAAKARAGLLKPSSVGVARDQVRAATAFVGWLRQRGRPVAHCRQADLDRWFGTGPSSRSHARRFISWAGEHHLAPRLRLPRRHPGSPDRLAHPERIALIHRLLTDEDLPLRDRVAGLIVLLYAQPVSRVSRLSLDSVTATDGEHQIRIANGVVPLPEPAGRLIAELAASRSSTATTAISSSPWLFPGRAPGQPITAKQLRQRLGVIGIDRLGRVAALDQLTGEIPAPVLADLTGYNPRVLVNRASDLAVDWSSYAALRTAEQTNPVRTITSSSQSSSVRRR